MAKAKPTPIQLSLFDVNQYERARCLRLATPTHYDIEDGIDEADYWPPQPVSESIEEFVSESNWPPDPTLDSLTNDSLTTFQPCGAIGKYHSGGNTRGNPEYWRFSYRDGNRVKHRHIPGGCCSNPIAASRVDEIRCAIATGRSVPQVLELIRSFTNFYICLISLFPIFPACFNCFG